jgi:hypothetical protein
LKPQSFCMNLTNSFLALVRFFRWILEKKPDFIFLFLYLSKIIYKMITSIAELDLTKQSHYAEY